MVKHSPQILASEKNATTTSIKVINVKLCVMVLHTELYLFIALTLQTLAPPGLRSDLAV